MARGIVLFVVIALTGVIGAETPTPSPSPSATEKDTDKASVRMVLEDATGHAFPQAIAIYDGDQTEFEKAIAQSKTVDEPVTVPAGRYWVVSNDDESQSELVTLAAGEAKEIKRKVERGLWVSVSAGAKKPNQRLLIVLRPKSDMERWLKGSRGAGDYHFSARRPDATDENLEKARKLALTTLPTLIADKPDPPETLSKEEAAIWRTRRFVNTDACYRILGVAGKREDIDSLLKMAGEAALSGWRESVTFAIASIEARYDLLENGRVAEMVRGKDERWVWPAAKALARLGLDAGQDVFRRELVSRKEESNAYHAAFRLSSDGNPETLKAMRAYLRSFSEESAKKTPPANQARVHLLTFGELADWRLAASFPFGPGDADTLAYLSENPRVLLRDRGTVAIQELRDRGPTELAAIRDWQNDIGAKQAIKAEPSLHPSQAYSNRMNTMILLQSSFFPDIKAVCFYRGLSGSSPVFKLLPKEGYLTTSLSWFAYPEHLDLFVNEWLAGKMRYVFQLDYVEHGKLEEAVKRLGNGRVPPGYEAYLAYHAIAHRQWFVYDPMPLGERRWPYLFAYRERNKSTGAEEFGGGISGVASLKAEWQGNTLALKVKLDQRVHYEQSGAMFGVGNRESKDIYPHHKYSIDGGRPLLASVVVRRGGTTFPVNDLKREQDGWFEFEAPMDSASLADLWVDVNLGFLDQKITLTEALFVGTPATQMRESRRSAPKEKAAETKDEKT